jgi:hypothetical protein
LDNDQHFLDSHLWICSLGWMLKHARSVDSAGASSQAPALGQRLGLQDGVPRGGLSAIAYGHNSRMQRAKGKVPRQKPTCALL